jgi:uracil-DNA glycosylase family 4
MSWHDPLLEELGIGPLWVSRTAASTVPQPVVTDLAESTLAVVRLASGPESGSPSGSPSGLASGPARQMPHAAAQAMPLVRALSEADNSAEPVGALGWDALEQRVAQCTLCTLCEKRTQTVFGVGDRQANWMLIGEAPGENEDKQGEPFVGPAGKLLDNMLQALALQRDENVFIANVLKCRPPGNRNPEPAEVERCAPYLQRQVALVQPKLIVAMGRFAAQSLLKTSASIASLRGRLHQYENVPVIVTYHPAYLLRSLPDKAKAWTDLCLAKATFDQLSG